MIFNSISFFVFFLIFFSLYWFAFGKNKQLQNAFLLIGSYTFYAFADWRFLSFLIAISFLNYLLGIQIGKNNNTQKWYLYLGLLQGIGGLFFFKYFNFFITSFDDLFKLFNINLGFQALHIIIPVGISFFTFRTIGYLLDINSGKIKPTKDWLVFFNYVSFFPTLLSGPIDKSKLFIPQLEKERSFDVTVATDGMRQILWGLFKKIVIADSCSLITNQVFNQFHTLNGSTLLLGAFFYTIQIYADFSGYSDMAIGVSRLLGFSITKNFDFPFFTQNISEFWRKWHISLTAWLTEYVFTPLSIAFRDYGKHGLALAIVINFTICGIWHGASWTYILFGFLHGCYFIPLVYSGKMNSKSKLIAKDKMLPSFFELQNMIRNFLLVMFTFIVFRCITVSDSIEYLSRIFSKTLFIHPRFLNKILLLNIFLLIGVEWFQRRKNHGLEIDWIQNRLVRWVVYYLLIFSILNTAGSKQPFIYFQF
jgi:D-alanyl-lipoteichoic acid acyltransferase DltB (MBOAT superfamily)